MGKYPYTDFMCALAKMTPEQRAQASAEKAAERYGIELARAEWEINWWRRN